MKKPLIVELNVEQLLSEILLNYPSFFIIQKEEEGKTHSELSNWDCIGLTSACNSNLFYYLYIVNKPMEDRRAIIFVPNTEENRCVLSYLKLKNTSYIVSKEFSSKEELYSYEEKFICYLPKQQCMVIKGKE